VGEDRIGPIDVEHDVRESGRGRRKLEIHTGVNSDVDIVFEEREQGFFGHTAISSDVSGLRPSTSFGRFSQSHPPP
jgi:hypothetical protein